MKNMAPNIGFADSSYRNCETSENDLSIYIKSWDNKIIKVVFSNVIYFVYREGGFIEGIYERDEKDSVLKEVLSSHYLNQPVNHPFKEYVIMDIDDCSIFRVVAEGISVSKI